MSWLFRNRYECVDVLGHGGFGEVWRAHDRHLDREVALKLFQPGFPPTAAFIEAQLVTGLHGDHILQVLNADVYLDIPYVVTVVADEGSAEDAMAPHGVSGPVAIRWITQLLVGLDVVHGAGLVHRDVKPSNVFLDTLDHARLGDFGVAARAAANGDVPAHGDWRIRAPEMYAAGSGSTLADVYSAGVSLWTLLAGRYPFTGSVAEIQAAVLVGDAPPIRDVAPHIPVALAQRVSRAMAVPAHGRFPSARAMRESLTNVKVNRSWTETQPHAGHHRCWMSPRTRTGPPLTVCVLSAPGGGFDIETRRASGSQVRIRNACHHVARERALMSKLRKVFTSL